MQTRGGARVVRATLAGKQRNLVSVGTSGARTPDLSMTLSEKSRDPWRVPQEDARQFQGTPPRLSGHLRDLGPRTEAAEVSAGSARSSRSSPESVASALGSHGASRGAWRRVQ